jgi:hypothetical protein
MNASLLPASSLTEYFSISNIRYILVLIKGGPDFESVIMETTPEILSRLKLLGHIQKGEKLGSRSMMIQPDGWTTRINRTWISPDNRNNTLKLVREVIGRAFEILTHNINTIKESEVIQCKLIIQDLIKAQTGILNLKSTYSEDVKFGCDLEILLQQIAARLAEIKKNYTGLFEPDPLQNTIEAKDADNSL